MLVSSSIWSKGDLLFQNWFKEFDVLSGLHNIKLNVILISFHWYFNKTLLFVPLLKAGGIRWFTDQSNSEKINRECSIPGLNSKYNPAIYAWLKKNLANLLRQLITGFEYVPSNETSKILLKENTQQLRSFHQFSLLPLIKLYSWSIFSYEPIFVIFLFVFIQSCKFSHPNCLQCSHCDYFLQE